MTKKVNFKPPKNKNDLTGLLANLIENKRVSVFIDGANLYFAGGVAKLRIDYKQLHSWFSSKSSLAGLNYYTAFDPEDHKQEDFLHELENIGYTVIKKPIKVYDNFTKGNMDIELAVDALMQKDLYDILILISGDGDFRYLVKALENQGKKSIILGVGGFTSFELHQEADNYFFLNRISRVWQQTRKVKEVIQPTIESELDSTKAERVVTDKQPAKVLKPRQPNPDKPVSKPINKPDDKAKLPVRIKLAKPKSSENQNPKIFLT